MIEIKVSSKFDDEIIDFLVDESYRLYAKLKGIEQLSPKNTEFLKEKLKGFYLCDKDNIKIYTAYKEKILIGCACITDSGCLRDIYVKEEYQHQGIGDLLLKKIIYDIDEISLTTYPDLVEFYRKNGFHIIQQNENSVEMKK